MEMAADVRREEDQETARRLAKKRKADKGKLGGDDGLDGDFGSVSGKKAYDLNMAVDSELDQKNGKKDAVELERLGEGGFIMGDEILGPVCEYEDKAKLGKKKRKKKKNKADKDTMEFEELENVGMGEGDDRVACESEKWSVTLEEGKELDMSKGEDKKRQGKKKRKESSNVPHDTGQHTLAAGDVDGGNKEREKGKGKNDAGEMRKEKVAQRKNKGKQVSFTDAVEVLGDGVDDKESNEDGLVHGKRFTPEEDAKILQAIENYIEMKQLGEKGMEVIQSYLKRRGRGCTDFWREIAKALPHRPSVPIRARARILLMRGDKRKFTKEEKEIILRSVEKYGRTWEKLAASLGRSDKHVKDCWRRIKPKNLRKGRWAQDEYQNLFDLVNLDLRLKANQEVNHGHRMIRENISWEAISDKLTTRNNKDCCRKWYEQLASPLVKQGDWADTDDYFLVEALQKVDAVCLEDVDWDNLLDHRSGDVCRQRWNQMVRSLCGHREKSFIEQVEVLSRRYPMEIAEYRK